MPSLWRPLDFIYLFIYRCFSYRSSQPADTQEQQPKRTKFEHYLKTSIPFGNCNVCFIFIFFIQFSSSYCQHLINVEANDNLVKGRKVKVSEIETYEKHNRSQCKDIEENYFCHPQPTQAELDLRIAYVIVAYKGSGLIENLLRAIYMPHNVYCLHLDKKSTANFKRAVHSFVDCLPNVFVTKKLIDVVWGHVSVLQAELNCMEDLFHSDVPWKYLITLVAQDYPLYDNKGIVEGLKKLNGLNNIESYPMPEHFAYRANKIWTLTETGKGKEHDGYRMDCTWKPKAPPPHNITVMKGWNHIAATRKFVEFVLYDKIATDFYQWLADIFIPDEVFFSSLQRHPGTPGGYHDNENPEWIMRAFGWVANGDNRQCFGTWIRENCWLSTRDLRWILAEKNRNKLFTQKIPYEYEENLVQCLSAAVQGREYPSDSTQNSNTAVS